LKRRLPNNMSILDKLKKTKDEADVAVDSKTPATAVVVESKESTEATPKTKAPAKSAAKKSDGRFGFERTILIKPLITEKAAQLSVHNQYCFAVHRDANKIMVAKAIEAIYNVVPLNVRMLNKRGKTVRSGKTSGTTKAWKKAIVTLKADDKIQIYEGV
jgi:large subunit ribosomal protein L23